MSFPRVFTFDETVFRQDYPEFGNENKFSSAMLNLYWNQATTIVNTHNYGYLHNLSRLRALNLMTAHLGKIQLLNTEGEVAGVITDAQIDKVHVSLVPPPFPNQFQWWLGTTTYGQQLLAMLQVKSVGGFYIPAGLPVLTAFRY